MKQRFRHCADGFTLIEIMVGMILTAILVMGVMTLFTKVNGLFFDLTLRQKAVFLLNGEMERLYAVYQHSTPAPVASQSSKYDGTRPAHASREHRVYASEHTLTADVTLDNFDDVEKENRVLHYNLAPPDEDVVNVIWLDQEKNITARISWLDDPIFGSDCWKNDSTGTCHLITLYLDYPFRYDDTNPDDINPLNATMGPVKTLVLRTIMGDR